MLRFIIILYSLTFISNSVPTAIADDLLVLERVKSRRLSLKPCQFRLQENNKMENAVETAEHFFTFRVRVALREVLFVGESVPGLGAGTGMIASILRPNEHVYYDGDSTVLQGTSVGTGAYVYDPRLLGISLGPFHSTSIDHALRLSPDLRKSVISEKVVLNGIDCNKISVEDHSGIVVTFWVTRKSDVIKFDYNSPGIWRETTESRYADSFANGVIPCETTTSASSASKTITIHRISTDFSLIANSEFTLKNLNMPVGTAVSDLRTSRRLGYWDGDSLSELTYAQQPRLSEPTRDHRWMIWLSVFVLTAILVGVAAFLKQRK